MSGYYCQADSPYSIHLGYLHSGGYYGGEYTLLRYPTAEYLRGYYNLNDECGGYPAYGYHYRYRLGYGCGCSCHQCLVHAVWSWDGPDFQLRDFLPCCWRYRGYLRRHSCDNEIEEFFHIAEGCVRDCDLDDAACAAWLAGLVPSPAAALELPDIGYPGTPVPGGDAETPTVNCGPTDWDALKVVTDDNCIYDEVDVNGPVDCDRMCVDWEVREDAFGNLSWWRTWVHCCLEEQYGQTAPSESADFVGQTKTICP